MQTLNIQIMHENKLVRVIIHRIHDRGNKIEYAFLESAFIGYNVEGQATNHAYICIYLHGGRNIRFELPRDNLSRDEIINDLHQCLMNIANPIANIDANLDANQDVNPHVNQNAIG